MSFVIKKRDLTDPAQLQALIVEHADDLEAGLTILDSRLLLGQTSIDVVGLDADGALVLIAVGLIADEEMFLKAVDAYSWCLEYPEAIRRIYPTVQFSAAQPPRVIFVVERMPDVFHRKIKQLGFAEVDCVEFRHLDVDGTPAIYFDRLARLRRGAAASAAVADQNAAPPAPVASGRPTSLKLQKLLGADRPAAGREPAPVVRMVHRAAPRTDPKPTASAPRTERAVAPSHVDDAPAAANTRPTVHAPPASSRVAAETVRMTEPVATAAAKPSLVLDVPAVASVTEALAGVPDLADAMVEPFVTIEQPTPNGHVHPSPLPIPEPELADTPAAPIVQQVVAIEPLAAPDDPITPEPLTETDVSTLVDSAPDVDTVAGALGIPEPETVAPALSAPEPDAIAATVGAPEADSVAASLGAPEADSVAASLSAPEPEIVVLPVLELEPRPLVEAPPPDSNPLDVAAATPTVAEPEPAAAPIAIAPEPVAEPIVIEREPAVAAVTAESLEPIAPAVPTPTPSVFARRPAEPAVTRTEPKVSFAGMAKDLLPHPSPAPRTEPSISIQRPSVEEITRAALDELVGGTENRQTAFAKPSGAFGKAPTTTRPRTIAPPPADGQPIGGGPKLGTVGKRPGAPAPATGTRAATQAETAQGVPEGFEALKFPNDGVLTRQWMEFLNQMAAGK